MRLSHFSDDPGIEIFQPRAPRVAVARAPNQEWLNAPLVWAIDEPHSILYLFPRECPRIVIWPTSHTTQEDRAKWIGQASVRAIAYIEADWLERLRSSVVYRYDMPTETFSNVEDVGMWVSRSAVRPLRLEHLTDLDARLCAADVELRAVKELTPLRPVWDSTLHASGIRLRNAANWAK